MNGASERDVTDAERRVLLLDFDRMLGLSLDSLADVMSLPDGAAELLERRSAARAQRHAARSDALYDELAALGVEVRDTPSGQKTTICSLG